MKEQLLTSADAARYVGVTSTRIRQLATAGRLGQQIAGRYYLFTQAELDAFKAQPKAKGGRGKKLLARTLLAVTPA